MTLPWMPSGFDTLAEFGRIRDKLRAGRIADRQPFEFALEDLIGARTGSSLWGFPVLESELVAPGTVLVMSGGRTMAVVANLSGADRYGDPIALARLLKPTPGYTRHTAGGREAARLNRRRARGLA